MGRKKWSYDQVRRDFEFLETIDELEDQVELDAMRLDLMRNPTKEFAAGMYYAAISSWLSEHGVPSEEVEEIALRYGHVYHVEKALGKR